MKNIFILIISYRLFILNKNMKNKFQEYLIPTEKEFNKLKKEAVFIFDTNVLLNLYRYSKDISNKYLQVMKKLKNENRIWLPYQVGYEFYENRQDVILTNKNFYDKLLEKIKRFKQGIYDECKRHPFLEISEDNKKLDKNFTNIIEYIEKTKWEHPVLNNKETIDKEIIDIFDGCIWEPYSEKDLENIELEWEKRYRENKAPWFKDKKKDKNPYWDYILRRQIIDYTKKEDRKKPIIFISWDKKEDRRLIQDGEKIMPLPELRKEIFDKSWINFRIRTPELFIKKFDKTITDEEKEEIKNIKINENIEYKNTYKKDVFLNEYDEKYIFNFQQEIISALKKIEWIIDEMKRREDEYPIKDTLRHIYYLSRRIRNSIVHWSFNNILWERLYILNDISEISIYLEKINIFWEQWKEIKEAISHLKYIHMKFKKIF